MPLAAVGLMPSRRIAEQRTSMTGEVAAKEEKDASADRPGGDSPAGVRGLGNVRRMHRDRQEELRAAVLTDDRWRVTDWRWRGG